MAKKYREKPCNEVEAFQWDGENIDIAHYFIEKQYHHEVSVICGQLWIKNSKNTVIAKKGDYIVKGVDGEFYVCEQDIFEKVYEEVKEPRGFTKRYRDKEPKSAQFMMYEHLASKAIAERGFTKRYRDIANLYERLAKGGIECSMTLDDKNSIYTIYCHGVELADNSERINKSFEDVFEEDKNDQ